MVFDALAAERLFQLIGFYHFVGYGLPFEQYHNGKRIGYYKQDVTLERILAAYEADQKLRCVLFSALEKVEVAVRSVINEVMCERYKNPH